MHRSLTEDKKWHNKYIYIDANGDCKLGNWLCCFLSSGKLYERDKKSRIRKGKLKRAEQL